MGRQSKKISTENIYTRSYIVFGVDILLAALSLLFLINGCIFRFRVWTLGEVKSLYSLRYILIDYYKHYNKLEFNAPEIHDVALKV